MRWGARLRSPWAAALATFAVAAIATIAVLIVRMRRDTDALRADTAHRAVGLARAVEERFAGPIESMHAVASLIAATGDARNDTFSRFARDAIHREPLVYAIEWAPRVMRRERAAFEAAARADGVDGFEIVDAAPNGAFVRAPERDMYYPLRFVVPSNGARGLDLHSPSSSTQRACERRGPVASPRIHLAEDPAGVGAVFGVEPVWAKGGHACDDLTGFVLLVFRIDPVMQDVVRRNDLGDLELIVRDRTGGGALLAESAAGAASRADEDLAAREPIAFVDRAWEVEVAPPGPPAPPWWILAVGALGAAIAAALAFAAASWLRVRRRVAYALQLGQYKIEEEIGRGGMGVVFRARHELLRRATALKLLSAPPGDDAALARFEREVRLTAELTHPNTIAIYDYGHTPDGDFYYAMEYIDGLTLHDVLEHDGAQPIARAAHLVRQIASALVEAHAIGLVHRDIKPHNLMITTRGGILDFVKVLDFGLVKRIGVDGDDGGVLSGTRGYTAPEALRGGDVDQRADVYSIGVVWYALLTGRTPFNGATEAAIVAAQHEGLAAPLTGVPAATAALVMRCFARDPAARVPSAQALLDEMGPSTWAAADARAWWDTRGRAVMEARHAVQHAHGRAPRTITIASTR